MLIVERISVKLFQQIERNVRLEFEEPVTDNTQVVVNADRQNFMAHLLQRRNHVPLSFEGRNFFRRQIVDGIRRHEVFVTQNHHAQFLDRVAVFGGGFGVRRL